MQKTNIVLMLIVLTVSYKIFGASVESTETEIPQVDITVVPSSVEPKGLDILFGQNKTDLKEFFNKLRIMPMAKVQEYLMTPAGYKGVVKRHDFVQDFRGNKSLKIEGMLADALAQRDNRVVTFGCPGSNNASLSK